MSTKEIAVCSFVLLIVVCGFFVWKRFTFNDYVLVTVENRSGLDVRNFRLNYKDETKESEGLKNGKSITFDFRAPQQSIIGFSVFVSFEAGGNLSVESVPTHNGEEWTLAIYKDEILPLKTRTTW